jgi:asparagine synthase (glutamine-hydrolysing)
MPGICGIIARNPMAEIGLRLQAMQQAMRHHPWYEQDEYWDADQEIALARTSLGFVNQGEQPAANEDGSLLAVMAGEIYECEAHRQRLTTAGHRFGGDSQAELLLHGYEEEGQRFLQRVNGTFVAAIWDVRQRRLILTNDRFGMKPLYYTVLQDRFLFGSELKCLLADSGVARRHSLRGLAQFFTFGQLFGEDTLLEHVRTLPPAAWLVYEPDTGRTTAARYWRLHGRDPGVNVKPQEALDRIDEAFQRAVDRRAAGTQRLGLSLSGGLDSRTILAVIDHDKVPITTISMGIEGSIDLLSAQRMAELVRCRHHNYVLNHELLANFEAHLRHMVHLTDGQYLSQCIVMPTLPLYRDLGIEVLLRGHAGELMHMQKAYNFSLDDSAFALRTQAELENWLLGRLRAYVADAGVMALFGRNRAAEMEDLARQSLRDGLQEAVDTEPLLHRVWHLFVTQRLRRETAMSMVKFGSLVETRLPFLDNDLIEALLAAPVDLKLDERIQTHILRRRRPAFLDVVNANTGARVGAGTLVRTLSKARLKVLAKLGVQGYQPYERLGLWLRRELRPLVSRLLLSDRCLERGLFDPQVLRGIVNDHFAGRRNHTFLLMAMLVYETGQQESIDQPSALPVSRALSVD